MPDFNDVVRHVILRITVDQAGLAESLAAARGKLAALKNSEKEINKERSKNHETVTKAIQAQNIALGDNERAHQAAQRARAGQSDSGAQAVRDQTKAINDETSAVKGQILEEAKAEQIRVKTRQSELDAIDARSRKAKDAAQQEIKNDVLIDGVKKKIEADQKQHDLDARARRSRENKQTVAEVEKALAEAKQIQEAARNLKLGGQTARTTKAAESSARVTAAQAKAAETVSRTAEVDERRARSEAREKQAAEDKKKREQEAEKRAADRAVREAARTLRAAGQEAERERKQQEREERAGASAAQRAAAKEERDRKAAEREAARAAAKEERDRKAAERESERVRQAAARDAERERKAAERDRKVAEREVERDRKKVEREYSQAVAENKRRDDRARADRYRPTRNLDEVVERAERSAYAEEVRRRQREAVRVSRDRQQHPFVAIFNDVARAASAATAGPDDTRYARSVRAMREVGQETGKVRVALAAFWRQWKTGEGDAVSVLEGIRYRVNNLRRELRSSNSPGGGGNLFHNLTGAIGEAAKAAGGALQSVAGHLFSFKGLIVLVAAAMGPLVAIIGAVGAAGLGLVSVLVSLSGVLLALPGLIGAAVAGFGALAIVMSPLSSVFSAFSAAQKEATANAKAGTTAQLDYRDALLSRRQAELAYQRAVQDLPRAEQKLSQARKQAARDIEDYRLARQKLRYDEEGAALGAESAELEFRKSLVDPTKTGLDRRIAQHNLEGAYFDKRDQDVAGRRLLEDSSEAFRKGIEGSDEYISALRGVQDATLDVSQTYVAWQKAILAVDKARKESLAGGTAASALQAELAKLPSQTRKVVQAILDLHDEYDDLRDDLSENIFGPLSKETGKFAEVLEDLRSFLTPVSVAIGELAKRALDLFTNPEWKKFFSDQGDEAAYIFEQLGDGALSLAGGLKAVVEEAAPFVRWLVDGVKSLAGEFDDWANSKAGRKSISDFLALTKKRIQEIWPIIKNVASGFADFFTALNSPGADGSADFTTKLIAGLTEASETFADLGKAALDPKSGFRKWLDNVGPLIKDVATFLGAAATSLGKMFSDPANMQEAHDLLKNLAEKWMPQLAGIFERLSESGAISGLAAAIGSIFDSINEFLDNGGIEALNVLAEVLVDLANVLKLLGEAGVLAGFASWAQDDSTDKDGKKKSTLATTDDVSGGALFGALTPVVDWLWAHAPKRMSGGLIEGVYQGIEDTARVMATPDEFIVRRSKVMQPGVKAFLRDFNEDRIKMSDLYGGLAAATSPQVMSMVPPTAQALTGAIPSVVNHTVNHAPLMGDVTIHNPVREKSENSLRRQVQIAAIRHRR